MPRLSYPGNRKKTQNKKNTATPLAQNIIEAKGDGGDRPAYWAERINSHLRNAVEEVIQAGRDLIEAKDELGHGRFTKMVEERLPFGLRTAEMLMAVANNPVLANPNHGSHLPPSWRTLSELAKLPPPVLEARIKDGSITPDLERKDVARLKPGLHPDRHAAAKHKAKMTALNKMKAEKDELERQNADLEERLTNAEAGNDSQLFEGHEDVEDIVDIICVRVGEDKAKEIATGILQRYKKPRGRPPGERKTGDSPVR